MFNGISHGLELKTNLFNKTDYWILLLKGIESVKKVNLFVSL